MAEQPQHTACTWAAVCRVWLVWLLLLLLVSRRPPPSRHDLCGAHASCHHPPHSPLLQMT